jgi:hypothetical protein
VFNYQQVKAVRRRRYQKYIEDRARAARPGQWKLSDLLGALAGRLAGLGFRDRDGGSFPASPAY